VENVGVDQGLEHEVHLEVAELVEEPETVDELDCLVVFAAFFGHLDLDATGGEDQQTRCDHLLCEMLVLLHKDEHDEHKHPETRDLSKRCEVLLPSTRQKDCFLALPYKCLSLVVKKSVDGLK